MEESKIDELKEYALSDTDIQGVLETPTNIFTYPQLKNIRHIDEIFDPLGRAIMLYLTEAENVGHYISLIKKGDVIEFYDPYGHKADTQQIGLGIPKDQDTRLNGGYPLLSKLAKDAGYTIKSNGSGLQKDAPDVNTCGRHAVLRTLMYDIPMEQYNRWLKSGAGNGIDTDDLVVGLTEHKLINKYK